jgi:Domain of unknown function (DUF4276)
MTTKSERVLFIEGTTDPTNGDLRVGFSNLLSQKLSGKMPRIVMGNGVSETMDKFKHAKLIPHKTAIIDLDGKGSSITLGQYDLAKSAKRKLHHVNSSDAVYLMVQKMEAWFLSQPEILNEHFCIKIKAPFDHPSKIENPDLELIRVTKQLKWKSYHKVRDGSRLLAKLDLPRLESVFEDVRDLIARFSL